MAPPEAPGCDPLWRLRQVRLRGVDGWRLDLPELDIPDVASLAILGPSGSGKSSLIHLLAGFEAPDEGVVRTHLPTPGPDSIPLFWAPQHDGLWPRLSIGEHIRRVSPEPLDTSRVRTFLDRLDLGPLINRDPETCSRGERNRLAVARAWASGARVILLDEPFAHVAGNFALAYLQGLLEDLGSAGRSVVFTTHLPGLARLASRSLELAEGRVVGPRSAPQGEDPF